MGDSDLPQLSDDQIELLFTICKAGSSTRRPPFAALSTAYNAECDRDGLSTSKDSAIFRWIMRLGEIARQGNFLNGTTNFTRILTDVLREQGITIVDVSAVEGESEQEPLAEVDWMKLDAMEHSAMAHDRQTLLRQSMDALRTAYDERMQEVERMNILEAKLARFEHVRNSTAMIFAMTQLRNSSQNRQYDGFSDAETKHQHLTDTVCDKFAHSTPTRAFTTYSDNKVMKRVVTKWSFQARIQTSDLRRDERVLRRAWRLFTEGTRRTQCSQSLLDDAHMAFSDRHRHKALRRCWDSLVTEYRRRSDADEAAALLFSQRKLPQMLGAVHKRSEDIQRLNKMSNDFRYYYLTTRPLRDWQTRTKQHRHERMTAGYAHVRAKVKTRIAKNCLNRMCAKSATVRSMDAEATQRAQARLFKVGTDAFDIWHAKSIRTVHMNEQATTWHDRTLEASTMAQLMTQRSSLAVNEEQAMLFRQESDLACAAGALKKLQWASFTAKRQVESADALRDRLDKQRARQMLKHLAARTVARQVDRANHTASRQSGPQLSEREDVVVGGGGGGGGEPESPSLRPASRRLAAVRSAEPFILNRSNPPSALASTATPAYLQTPARSRRVVRFRPLPTPAPVTPFRLSGNRGRWSGLDVNQT